MENRCRRVNVKSTYITSVPYNTPKKKNKKWVGITILVIFLLVLPILFLLSGLKFSKEQALHIFNAIQEQEGRYTLLFEDKLPEEIAFYEFEEGGFYGVAEFTKVPKLPLWKVKNGEIQKINRAKVFDIKSDFSDLNLRVIPVNQEDIAYIALSKLPTKEVLRLDEIATERDNFIYTAVQEGFALFQMKDLKIEEYTNVLAFSKDNMLVYYQNDQEELMDVKTSWKPVTEEIQTIEKLDWELTLENASGFLLSEGDTKTFTQLELMEYRFTPKAIYLALNELYARHGKVFEDVLLKEYFEGKSWYQKDDKYRNRLNSVERANEKTLKALLGTYYSPKILEEDLNGDAIKDFISFEENDLTFRLNVNDYEFKGKGQNFLSDVSVMDLNETDDSKEIVIRVIFSPSFRITFFSLSKSLSANSKKLFLTVYRCPNGYSAVFFS